MATVRFTGAASGDLRRIVVYSRATWGAAHARVYLDGLAACCSTLADRPGTGQPRQEIGAKIRSFPFQSHVVFYAEETSGIVIIRVLHKRMDAGRHIAPERR